MTATALKQENETPVRPTSGEGSRVFWSKSERLMVALKWKEILDKNPNRRLVSLMDALEAAQSILPAARRRTPVQAEIVKMREVLAEQAKLGGVAVQTEKQVQPKLNIGPETNEEWIAARRADLTKLPTSPSLGLGPLEMALASLVERATTDSIARIIEMMKVEMAAQREEFQHLLTEQYDSLMSYWDPDYKKLRDTQPSYVGDLEQQPAFRATLEQVRVRPKRVLVSGGQTDQYHGLRERFRGVEFTFVDGREPRKIGAGGFYDLVVCTKYTNHPARDTLIRLHGNKVVMVDGAIGPVTDVIRRRLGL